LSSCHNWHGWLAVAYLWQKLGSVKFSEKAKELLLAYWRNKTSWSYESHGIVIIFQDLLLM